jgi:hypothetical protein
LTIVYPSGQKQVMQLRLVCPISSVHPGYTAICTPSDNTKGGVTVSSPNTRLDKETDRFNVLIQILNSQKPRIVLDLSAIVLEPQTLMLEY